MSNPVSAVGPVERREHEPEQIHTHDEEFVEARIIISTPRPGFVGQRVQIQGTAFVHMRAREFIKMGGHGTRTTHDFYVTGGLQIALRVGQTEVRPQVTFQGDRVHWSYTIPSASPGPLLLVASLSGVVEESHTSLGLPPVSTSEHYADSSQVQVTVDYDPPDVVAGFSLTMEPPWYAVLQGTAQDESGVQSMRWHRSDGATGAVQNDSGNWSLWHASVPLLDRRQRTDITVAAVDRAGNEAAITVTIAGDTTPPTVVTIRPYSPYPVLWVPGGITVLFEGTAFDGQTGVQTVQWQLDSGPQSPAEQTGAGWSLWRVPVRIGTPGVHFVRVQAVDRVGNASEPIETEIRVQE